MDLQIRIKNYENYKGRTDVKTNTWFRLSNRFLEDHEFFDFNSDEKIVWIYLLSLASQKNSGDIHVSYQHAHHVCKIDKKVLTRAIEKLTKIKCIERARTRTLRGRYVPDTDPCATDRQTDITEQDKQTNNGVRPDDDLFEIAYKLYPIRVKGSHCEKRYREQIKTRNDHDNLILSITNYVSFLSKPENNWRKPKQSFSAYLGTESSGFFWTDWIESDSGSSSIETKNDRADLSEIWTEAGV